MENRAKGSTKTDVVSIGTAGISRPPINDNGNQLTSQPHFRIFLADDDVEMRRILAAALRRDGHDVVEATDGSALLGLMGSRLLTHNGLAVDLIISDQRMPGTTGLEVLMDLRDSDSKVPFILITAFGDGELHTEAQRLGAVVLDKPFDLPSLRAAVQSFAPRTA